jgi:hypothetical protein
MDIETISLVNKEFKSLNSKIRELESRNRMLRISILISILLIVALMALLNNLLTGSI